MLRGMAESKKVRAAEWAKRVERWKRSGLSAEEFSAREGLRAARLSWWRWYLSRKEPHRDVAAPSKPQFVPARVVERGDTKPVSSCLEVGDVIAKLQRGWPQSRISELLPDRWLAARAPKAA